MAQQHMLDRTDEIFYEAHLNVTPSAWRDYIVTPAVAAMVQRPGELFVRRKQVSEKLKIKDRCPIE